METSEPAGAGLEGDEVMAAGEAVAEVGLAGAGAGAGYAPPWEKGREGGPWLAGEAAVGDGDGVAGGGWEEAVVEGEEDGEVGDEEEKDPKPEAPPAPTPHQALRAGDSRR